MKKYSLPEIDLLREYVRLTHVYPGKDNTEEVIRTIMTAGVNMKDLLNQTKNILKKEKNSLEEDRKAIKKRYEGYIKLFCRYTHTDTYGREDEEKIEYYYVNPDNLEEKKEIIKKEIIDDRKYWNERVKKFAWRVSEMTDEDIESKLSDFAKRKIEDLKKLSQDIKRLCKN